MIGAQVTRRLSGPRGKRSLARKSTAVSQAVHTSAFIPFVLI
ncbi:MULTISPECIES: hypothetical protein [Priestia]|nr:hypothetical protein [Priestia megaterium]